MADEKNTPIINGSDITDIKSATKALNDYSAAMDKATKAEMAASKTNTQATNERLAAARKENSERLKAGEYDVKWVHNQERPPKFASVTGYRDVIETKLPKTRAASSGGAKKKKALKVQPPISSELPAPPSMDVIEKKLRKLEESIPGTPRYISRRELEEAAKRKRGGHTPAKSDSAPISKEAFVNKYSALTMAGKTPNAANILSDVEKAGYSEAESKSAANEIVKRFQKYSGKSSLSAAVKEKNLSEDTVRDIVRNILQDPAARSEFNKTQGQQRRVDPENSSMLKREFYSSFLGSDGSVVPAGASVKVYNKKLGYYSGKSLDTLGVAHQAAVDFSRNGAVTDEDRYRFGFDMSDADIKARKQKEYTALSGDYRLAKAHKEQYAALGRGESLSAKAQASAIELVSSQVFERAIKEAYNNTVGVEVADSGENAKDALIRQLFAKTPDIDAYEKLANPREGADEAYENRFRKSSPLAKNLRNRMPGYVGQYMSQAMIDELPMNQDSTEAIELRRERSDDAQETALVRARQIEAEWGLEEGDIKGEQGYLRDVEGPAQGERLSRVFNRINNILTSAETVDKAAAIRSERMGVAVSPESLLKTPEAIKGYKESAAARARWDAAGGYKNPRKALNSFLYSEDVDPDSEINQIVAEVENLSRSYGGRDVSHPAGHNVVAPELEKMLEVQLNPESKRSVNSYNNRKKYYGNPFGEIERASDRSEYYDPNNEYNELSPAQRTSELYKSGLLLSQYGVTGMERATLPGGVEGSRSLTQIERFSRAYGNANYEKHSLNRQLSEASDDSEASLIQRRIDVVTKDIALIEELGQKEAQLQLALSQAKGLKSGENKLLQGLILDYQAASMAEDQGMSGEVQAFVTQNAEKISKLSPEGLSALTGASEKFGRSNEISTLLNEQATQKARQQAEAAQKEQERQQQLESAKSQKYEVGQTVKWNNRGNTMVGTVSSLGAGGIYGIKFEGENKERRMVASPALSLVSSPLAQEPLPPATKIPEKAPTNNDTTATEGTLAGVEKTISQTAGALAKEAEEAGDTTSWDLHINKVKEATAAEQEKESAARALVDALKEENEVLASAAGASGVAASGGAPVGDTGAGGKEDYDFFKLAQRRMGYEQSIKTNELRIGHESDADKIAKYQQNIDNARKYIDALNQQADAAGQLSELDAYVGKQTDPNNPITQFNIEAALQNAKIEQNQPMVQQYEELDNINTLLKERRDLLKAVYDAEAKLDDLTITSPSERGELNKQLEIVQANLEQNQKGLDAAKARISANSATLRGGKDGLTFSGMADQMIDETEKAGKKHKAKAAEKVAVNNAGFKAEQAYYSGLLSKIDVNGNAISKSVKTVLADGREAIFYEAQSEAGQPVWFYRLLGLDDNGNPLPETAATIQKATKQMYDAAVSSAGSTIDDNSFKTVSKNYLQEKQRYGNAEVEEARLNRLINSGDLSGDRLLTAKTRLGQITQEKAKLSQRSPSIEKTYDSSGTLTGGTVSVYDAATGASQKYSLSVQQLNLLLEQEAKLTYDLEGRLSSASRATLKSQSLFSAVIGGLKNSMRNMIDYQLAGRIVGSVQQGIQKLIQTVTQLDSAFTDLAIASDKTRAQISADFTEYNNLAVKVGSTTTEVAKAANDWLRAGYEGQEAMSLTEASMRLSVLGMEDATSATSQLISVLKGWKIESTEVMGIVDKLTAIDMNAAISAGELAEGMSQANNMARESGMSLNTFAGAVATVVDVSQMDPNRVGNAMRTAMSRYSNVKAGKFAASADDMESEDYAAEDWVALNDTETVMKSMGLTIREDVNTFKSYEDVLSETAARWSEFTDVERSAIGTAMAGTRQREAFLVLMQNWDQVVRLSTVAEDSLGTSEKKMGIYTESLAAAQARVTAAIEEWTSKLGASKVLIWFNNSLADIIKNLSLLVPLLGSAAALTNFGSLTEWFGGRVASQASKLGYGVNVPGTEKPKGIVGLVKAAFGDTSKFIKANFQSGYNEKLSDVFSDFLSSFNGKNALTSTGSDVTTVQAAYNTLLGSANSSAVQNLFSKFKEGANSADTVAAAFKDLAASADDTVSAEVKNAAAVMAGVDSKTQEKVATDMAASATQTFGNALRAVGAKILATTGGALLGGAIGKLTGNSSGVGTILGGVAGNLLPGILSKVGLAEKTVSAVSGIAGIAAGVVGVAINAYVKAEQEKLEKANENYEAATETLSKAAAAKTNIKEYDELAAGVDKFGENLTLTDDEYERFKTLSAQLAEAYPALKVRTNELGESFVGLNGKVGALGDVTEQYNNALLASAAALTDPTLTKKLYKAATEDSSYAITDLQQMLNAVEADVAPYTANGNMFSFKSEAIQAMAQEELAKNGIGSSTASGILSVSYKDAEEAAAIIGAYMGSAEKIQGLIDQEYANLAAQNADLVKIGIARMRVNGAGYDKKYDDMSEGEQNFITSSIQVIDTTDMPEQEWQDTVDSLTKSISTVFAENPAIVDIMYEVDDSASVNSVLAARDQFMNALFAAFKTGGISADEEAILVKWGFEYTPDANGGTVSDVGNYISRLQEMVADEKANTEETNPIGYGKQLTPILPKAPAATATLSAVMNTANGIAYNDVAYALELLNNGIIVDGMGQAIITQLIKQAKYSDMSVGKLAGEIERLQDIQEKIDNSVDGVYSKEDRGVVASDTKVAENALMDYAEALGYTREELDGNVKLMAEFIAKAKAMGSITPYGGVTTAPDRVRSEYEELLGYQSTLISGGKLSNEEIEGAMAINPDIAAAVASGDWDAVRTAVDQAIANSDEKYRLALGETYMSGPNFSAENWGKGTDLWGSAVAGFGGDFTNVFANDFETLKLFSNQLNSAYDAFGNLVNPTQLSSAKTTLMSGVSNIFGLTGFDATGTIDEQIASFMAAYSGAAPDIQQKINAALGTNLDTDTTGLIFSDPTFWSRMFGDASVFNAGLIAFINNVFAGVTLAPTFSEKLAGVTKEIDAVNTAYDEFASNGKLTYSNLEGIRTEFASAMDADSLEHYIGLLSDANLTYEEMRTILGQMTRDGIEQALSNQEIIDMGKDQLALYLKEKGIKDAEAVASELIIDSKVEEIQLTGDYAKLLEGNTEITIEGLEEQFGIEEDIAKVVAGRLKLEKQGQKLQATATAIRDNPNDAAGGVLLDNADFVAQTAEAQEYITALYGVGAGAAFAQVMTIMFDKTGIDTEAEVAEVNALSAAFLNEAGSAALAKAAKDAYKNGGVVDPATITDMFKNFQSPIFTTGGGGGGSKKDRLREVLDQLEAIQELLDKDIYLMDEFNASADGVAGAMSRISEALKLVDIQSTGDYFADAAALYEKLADEYQVYYDAELKKGAVDDESELEFMTRMLGIQKEMNDLVKEKNDLNDEEVTDSIELAELMNTAFDAMYAYKLELMETADTTKEYLEYLKEARDLLSEQYGALIDIQQTWNGIASTNLENLSNANVFTPEGLSDVKGEFLDMLKSTSKGVDLIIGEFDSVVGQLGTDIQEQMKQGIASDSLKAFYKKYFREVFSAASLDLTSAGSFDAGVDYSSLMMGAKSYDEFVKYATLRESKIKSSGADVKAQGWKTTDEIYNQWATNNEGLAANGQELTDSLLHLKTVLSAKTASDPAAAFEAMQSFVAEAQAAGVSADVIQQLLEMTTSLSDTMDQYAENFKAIMDKFEESMDESEAHLEALGTLTTKQKYENAALRVEQARDMKQAAYEAGYLTESLQETINKYISDTHDEMIGLMRDYQDEVQTAMIDSVNEYISALEKEKESTTEYYDDMLDKLNRVNDAKKESVRLEELQRNLRNAQQEKSRVYTEGVGWTYQANRSKISEAEDELDSYYLTQRISDLENSKDNELKALDDSIQNWNDYIDALEAAYDETNSIRQADLLMSEWGVTTKSELYKKTLEDRESFIEQFESGNEKYLGYMRDFYEEVKKYLGLFGEVYSAEANLGTVSGGLSVGNLDSGLSYDASVDYAALMLKAKSQAEFDYYAALRTAKANGEGINISGTENGGFQTNDQLQSAWSTPTTVTTTTTTTTTTTNTKTNPTPGPAPAPKKAVPTPGPAPAPKKAVPTPGPAPAPKKAVPTPGPAPAFPKVVLTPGPDPAPKKAVPTSPGPAPALPKVVLTPGPAPAPPKVVLTSPGPAPAPPKVVLTPGPAPAPQKAVNKPQEYATGLDAGPVTYTGLSMLHGTPSNPEYVLTNDQAYNILSNLGATTKTPKFETAGGSRGNSYNISGDVVITNPIGPNEFWSTLAQNVSTRFSVTKENLKRG